MPRTTLTQAWLAASLLDQLIATSQAAVPNETGGVLMGYLTDERGVVITTAVGPGPNAVHKPTEFIPDPEYHAQEIERIYHASGRLDTYLGDWHSHPSGTSRISRADCSTLHAIAAAPEARAPHPIMAIVASNPQWHAEVWVYRPNLLTSWFLKPAKRMQLVGPQRVRAKRPTGNGCAWQRRSIL